MDGIMVSKMDDKIKITISEYQRNILLEEVCLYVIDRQLLFRCKP